MKIWGNNFKYSIMNISKYLLFVTLGYIAYSHGWTMRKWSPRHRHVKFSLPLLHRQPDFVVFFCLFVVIQHLFVSHFGHTASLVILSVFVVAFRLFVLI